MILKKIEENSFKIEISHTLQDDEKEIFPRFATHLIEEGILEFFIPKKLEGKMESIEKTLLMGRLISRRDLTSAIAIGQSFLGALPVWLYGNEEQKKDLALRLKNKGLCCLALTEKENGSDLMRTTARDQKGELTGEKWCINNATKSSSMTVLALNSSELPNLHFIQKEKKFEGTFKNLEKIKTLGIRGADISGIQFEKFSQENSLIGKEGQGVEIVLKTMQISRLLCASFSLGASDTMLRLALNFAQKRVLYGSPILELASVQKKLFDSFQKLQLIEAFSIVSARLITMHPDSLSIYSALSKFYTTRLADEIIQQASEVIGARFYIRDSEYGMAQKIVRDHRVVSLFDGNSDVNISIVANQLKRLSKIGSLEIDPKPIFDLSINASDFTGSEKLKLTSRGQDIIWETVKDYKFEGRELETRQILLQEREALFSLINSIENMQSNQVIDLVREFAELTYKANLFLVSHFNKTSKWTIETALKQLEENKLFSLQDIKIND